ncbi:unnamed protein product [Adineta ricciae]|uniref:CCHC-type domain-containing protein n=1 Tax=Adineta ricciae TaxID=249248 RepID=A0A813V049_ADIRI|nr:unnamed protein product [Adineta ricciae]CAF0835238.1 unnamed protein product [Adineta ricciae]
MQTYVGIDGSQILYDPQSGNSYTLIGNNFNNNNVNYNGNYRYFQQSKNNMPQNYDNGYYEQRGAHSHISTSANSQQRHTNTIDESSKQQQYQHKYQKQTNTGQKSVQQMDYEENNIPVVSIDKERREDDSAICTSTPDQRQREQNNVITTEDHSDGSANNFSSQHPSSSGPKRPLNDSGEFVIKSSNKTRKKSHYREDQQTNTIANENGKPNHPIPVEHLQRAVVHNLPCFVIKFSQVDNLPGAVAVAEELYESFSNNKIQLVDQFSVVRYSGLHLRIGVKNKEDYRTLCNEKNWPSKILGRTISVNIPKFVPEQFSLVVRFVPKEFDTEQIAREVKRSASTANNFREIIYPYTRATKDFRFSVTDIKEYNGLLKLGHIGIANMMRKITPYRPSNKLTYCTKCWRLGHIRSKCPEASQKCRICLEDYNQEHNDECSKQYKCAQCHEEHYSLDGECPEIQQHRQELNKAVKAAVREGTIQNVTTNQTSKPSQNQSTSNTNLNFTNANFPPLPSATMSKQNTKPPPWAQKNTAITTNQTNDITNDQLFEKLRNHIDQANEKANTKIQIMEEKLKLSDNAIAVLHNRVSKMVEILQTIVQAVALTTTNIPNSITSNDSEVNMGELVLKAMTCLREERNILNIGGDGQPRSQEKDDTMIMEVPVRQTQTDQSTNPNVQ